MDGPVGRALRRAVVSLAVAGTIGCARRPPGPSLVVLYVVDTLRADHTSVYGYARDTTPELARLAQDAIVFDPAITAASWTKPAVASILTSQYPGRHGAVQLADVLPPSLPTLPALLRSRGFVTAAVVANPVLTAPGSGFERGFGDFVALRPPPGPARAKVAASSVVDAALRWLDGHPRGPVFLYLHTMDPHLPYAPPPPFDRRYGPPPAPPQHPAADPRFDYREPIDRDRLVAQYDGEVAYGDREFGRFLEGLRSRGRYDGALIVFTADHGEEFLDHGGWTHGHGVFEEVVRVPLVMKLPQGRKAGRIVRRMVRTVDILPTVLTECAVAVPDGLAGRPLPLVAEEGVGEEPAVSSISHHGFVAVGIRTARGKYIRRFSPSDDELYFDLGADPGETRDRANDFASVVAALRPRIADGLGAGPVRPHLRFTGQSTYALELRSSGRFEAVDANGFGSGDRYRLESAGERLLVSARPRSDAPRDIVFDVRPQGAPVWISGTRDGRPLAPSDVHIAREDLAPAGIPFKLPDLEPADQTSRSARGRAVRPPDRGPFVDETRADLESAPPAAAVGLCAWLDRRPGTASIAMDDDTRSRLSALGYLGR